MLEIGVEKEAKSLLREAIARVPSARVGVIISRQGREGDVKRDASGKAVWSIEQRHPWRLEVQPLDPIPDTELVHVDGIAFWVEPFPGREALRVVISAVDGQLHVDALPG